MDLPVVRLTTDGGKAVVSKEDYLAGHVSISDGLEAAMTIKGHGNSSWNWPKKPYKVKLEDKTSLLGMPASKSWILLANYIDRSLLRNRVAFFLSDQLKHADTPPSAFVETFLNGEYIGVYQLTQEIKAHTDFLLEIEPATDDHVYVHTASGVQLAVREPDPPSDEQAQAITTRLQAMEDALGSDAQAQQLDEDAAITWYWVNELMRNIDADLSRSVYLTQNKDGPITFGPVWDFDVSSGNFDQLPGASPEGYHVRNASWYAKMFAVPAFAEKAKAKWQTIDLAPVLAFIDAQAASLALGQANNFQRWTTLSAKLQNAPIGHGSYAAEVDALELWLQQRTAWIEAQQK
jgi:hypothetical protein